MKDRKISMNDSISSSPNILEKIEAKTIKSETTSPNKRSFEESYPYQLRSQTPPNLPSNFRNVDKHNTYQTYPTPKLTETYQIQRKPISSSPSIPIPTQPISTIPNINILNPNPTRGEIAPTHRPSDLRGVGPPNDPPPPPIFYHHIDKRDYLLPHFGTKDIYSQKYQFILKSSLKEIYIPNRNRKIHI